MEKKPSLIINAASNWFALGINVAIGFFLTPFIIRYIGKSGYGIWTLIGAFVGYYGLLNIGVNSAITKYIASYSQENKLKNLNEVVSTALTMFCTTGIIAILISFVMAGTIADFFQVLSEERSGFVKLLWILGITTGISFPSSVFAATITAREHFVASNIIIIATSLLRAGLTVVLLISNWGLIGVGFASLAANFMGILANFFLFRLYARDILLKLAFVNSRTLKKLIVYGSFSTIIIIADNLRTNIDSLVIGKWVSLEAVGIYGLAALVIRYMVICIGASMNVLTPRFVSLDASDNLTQLRELFQKSLFYSAYISFGMATLAILFAKTFIRLWVGTGFDQSATILTILVIAWTTDLAQNPGVWLMYALNKHRFYAYLTLIEGTINFVLSIILAPRYGIIGVAMGTFIPMVGIRLLIQPLYVSKIIKMKITDYLRLFLLPLLAAVLLLLIGFSIEFIRNAVVGSIFLFGFYVGGTGICFVLILYAVSFFINPGLSPTGMLRFIIKTKIV